MGSLTLYKQFLARLKNTELSSLERVVQSRLSKMPDTYGLTNRPVVRKLSTTSSDLFKKFDRRDSTGDSPSLSSSGTTTPLLRSRQGSIKKVRSKAEVSLIQFNYSVFFEKRCWVWFCFRLISVKFSRTTHDLMQGQIRD